MEKTIWKFELKIMDEQLIHMPKGADLLSVQTQNGIPCMWVLVDPNNDTEDRYFEVFGTGHKVHCDMGVEREYVGTFQMHNGGLVFHLFERK